MDEIIIDKTDDFKAGSAHTDTLQQYVWDTGIGPGSSGLNHAIYIAVVWCNAMTTL